MPYRNDYKFNITHKGGVPTKWYQVVKLVEENGPMRKRDIIAKVWPNYNDNWSIRGYMSSLFAQLNYEGIVCYDPCTMCWYRGYATITENTKPCRKTKSEYIEDGPFKGLRAPRKGEWNGGTMVAVCMTKMVTILICGANNL